VNSASAASSLATSTSMSSMLNTETGGRHPSFPDICFSWCALPFFEVMLSSGYALEEERCLFPAGELIGMDRDRRQAFVTRKPFAKPAKPGLWSCKIRQASQRHGGSLEI
jgi:hypothetical protein